MEINRLSVGDVLTHKELYRKFKCSSSGGIRPSKKTNTVVIISDITDPFYLDKWDEDILNYTGTGRKGDQELFSGLNKRLAELNLSDFDGYLFEKNKPNNYKFLGQVILDKEPFQEIQLDDDEKMRKVWIFPLKLTEDISASYIEKEILEDLDQQYENKIRKMNKEKLKERARKANGKVGKRICKTKVYQRDAYVKEYALERAEGVCQLCNDNAPFLKENDEPYLEVHHIEWLSEGGKDVIENTVALCPNCHRKMHIINDKDDVNTLKTKVNRE